MCLSKDALKAIRTAADAGDQFVNRATQPLALMRSLSSFNRFASRTNSHSIPTKIKMLRSRIRPVLLQTLLRSLAALTWSALQSFAAPSSLPRSRYCSYAHLLLIADVARSLTSSLNGRRPYHRRRLGFIVVSPSTLSGARHLRKQKGKEERK